MAKQYGIKKKNPKPLGGKAGKLCLKQSNNFNVEQELPQSLQSLFFCFRQGSNVKLVFPILAANYELILSNQ